MLSCRVTVALQVDTFPFTSVTVRVTVFVPMLAQEKLLGLTVTDWMPQLSELPLLICAAVILAFPAASNCTVMFWQTAVGAMLSCTVTVALQVDTLPFTSVTVRVTVFVPMLAQEKLLGLTVTDWMPQLSVLPLLICAAVMLAVPLALS